MIMSHFIKINHEKSGKTVAVDMPCWIHRGAIADAQNICMGRDTKAVDKVSPKPGIRGLKQYEIRRFHDKTCLVCEQKVKPTRKCRNYSDMCI